VLDGLDLDLAPGRTVALVGRSGAGKSTLADVLLRFLPYQSGSVTLDGVEISELAGAEYRRVIGLVSQDAHIFATTIRENLRLARVSATDDDLDAAAAAAHLLDWIATLPDGWDTLVGEHGAQISGGQRRRLALARALLADFPVLVVDEPTEALDDATAAAVMRDIVDAGADRALLVISHRAADMAPMREVHTMRNGILTRNQPQDSG